MSTVYQLNDIKVFYQQHCILDIAKLSIAENKCIVLLGDNGAGKSTLLDLLAFITPAQQGQILFHGQLYHPPLPAKQRRKIAYVAQHPLLLRGSISDNIALALQLQGIARRYHAKLIAAALEQVNLSDLAGQNIATLSGGELKRAAIARAIAYQPTILLLDEPFSHLDQHHYQLLENIISELRNQASTIVIFSTHNRLHGLSLADDTINLVKGKISASPLVNIFQGQLVGHIFDTGILQIHTLSQAVNSQTISIDPHDIIVSLDPLTSSMRNNFQGRLTLIAEENGAIRLSVNCGEIFHVIISHEALSQLKLQLGNTVYLSFKSAATQLI